MFSIASFATASFLPAAGRPKGKAIFFSKTLCRHDRSLTKQPMARARQEMLFVKAQSLTKRTMSKSLKLIFHRFQRQLLGRWKFIFDWFIFNALQSAQTVVSAVFTSLKWKAADAPRALLKSETVQEVFEVRFFKKTKSEGPRGLWRVRGLKGFRNFSRCNLRKFAERRGSRVSSQSKIDCRRG